MKGSVIGQLRDADDGHDQILPNADATLHRLAVHVRSSAAKEPATLLFTSLSAVPRSYTDQLQALPIGQSKLNSRPGGVAHDDLRSGLIKPSAMKPVPPDLPGHNNDLKDLLETAVIKALQQPGSPIVGLGEKWGPEPDKADQYFQVLPGSGCHDPQMDQGNSGKYKADNGSHQDGALFFCYPTSRWPGIFLAFQSQSFKTDSRGHPI